MCYTMSIERSYIMMKMYYVEYWDKNGRKIGMPISAYSALDAKLAIETHDDFKTLVKYPEPMGR